MYFASWHSANVNRESASNNPRDCGRAFRTTNRALTVSSCVGGSRSDVTGALFDGCSGLHLFRLRVRVGRLVFVHGHLRCEDVMGRVRAMCSCAPVQDLGYEAARADVR